MAYKTSSDSRNEQTCAGFLLAAGCAATALIWRQSEWELLVIKSLLLLITTFALLRHGRIYVGGSRTGMVAAGALLALSSIGMLQLARSASAVRLETLRSVLDWWVAVAVFWCAWALCRRSRTRQWLLRAIAIFAALLCALATLQFFTSEGKIFWMWPAAEPQVFGPFQSRNNYASFAILMIPLVAWKGFSTKLNWYYLSAGTLMAASVIASGSRAGAALLVMELVLLSFLFRPLRSGRILAAAVTLLAGGIGIAGWSHLEYKLSDGDPFRYRREMLDSALSMLRERPIEGFGLGTFAAVYPAFAQFDSGHYVNHAHNDWAELAAEGGFPALACLMLFAASTLPAIRQNPWGLGIPLVFLHGLVDYPLQRLGVLFWLLLLSAALLQQGSSDLKHKNRSAEGR